MRGRRARARGMRLRAQYEHARGSSIFISNCPEDREDLGSPGSEHTLPTCRDIAMCIGELPLTRCRAHAASVAGMRARAGRRTWERVRCAEDAEESGCRGRKRLTAHEPASLSRHTSRPTRLHAVCDVTAHTLRDFATGMRGGTWASVWACLDQKYARGGRPTAHIVPSSAF